MLDRGLLSLNDDDPLQGSQQNNHSFIDGAIADENIVKKTSEATLIKIEEEENPPESPSILKTSLLAGAAETLASLTKTATLKKIPTANIESKRLTTTATTTITNNICTSLLQSALLANVKLNKHEQQSENVFKPAMTLATLSEIATARKHQMELEEQQEQIELMKKMKKTSDFSQSDENINDDAETLKIPNVRTTSTVTTQAEINETFMPNTTNTTTSIISASNLNLTNRQFSCNKLITTKIFNKSLNVSVTPTTIPTKAKITNHQLKMTAALASPLKIAVTTIYAPTLSSITTQSSPSIILQSNQQQQQQHQSASSSQHQLILVNSKSTTTTSATAALIPTCSTTAVRNQRHQHQQHHQQEQQLTHQHDHHQQQQETQQNSILPVTSNAAVTVVVFKTMLPDD